MVWSNLREPWGLHPAPLGGQFAARMEMAARRRRQRARDFAGQRVARNALALADAGCRAEQRLGLGVRRPFINGVARPKLDDFAQI
jgi:hypothetical protein